MRKIMPLRAKVFASAAFAVGLSCSASAQTAQVAPPTDSVPEKMAPGSTPTDPPKSLSDKLDQSNGVIHPKEVDPAIERPAPETGTDGVIAPPGTQGGPSAPQPK